MKENKKIRKCSNITRPYLSFRRYLRLFTIIHNEKVEKYLSLGSYLRQQWKSLRVYELVFQNFNMFESRVTQLILKNDFAHIRIEILLLQKWQRISFQSIIQKNRWALIEFYSVTEVWGQRQNNNKRKCSNFDTSIPEQEKKSNSLS